MLALTACHQCTSNIVKHTILHDWVNCSSSCCQLMAKAGDPLPELWVTTISGQSSSTLYPRSCLMSLYDLSCRLRDWQHRVSDDTPFPAVLYHAMIPEHRSLPLLSFAAVSPVCKLLRCPNGTCHLLVLPCLSFWVWLTGVAGCGIRCIGSMAWGGPLPP